MSYEVYVKGPDGCENNPLLHDFHIIPRFVAVAGGSSPTLGGSIVTAISHTENTPVISTRKSANETRKFRDGVEVGPVDYADHASLLEALKDVHTVICVIMVPGPEWFGCQINLLNAAKEAGVKRFAPS